MKTLLSTVLLLFFLMGQVNLTWAKHFCGEKLVSATVALAGEVDHGCESQQESNAPTDCCQDEVLTSDSDDLFDKTDFQLKISPEFILSYVFIFGLSPSESQLAEQPDFVTPDKPIPDLNILHQTFLI